MCVREGHIVNFPFTFSVLWQRTGRTLGLSCAGHGSYVSGFTRSHGGTGRVITPGRLVITAVGQGKLPYHSLTDKKREWVAASDDRRSLRKKVAETCNHAGGHFKTTEVKRKQRSEQLHDSFGTMYGRCLGWFDMSKMTRIEGHHYNRDRVFTWKLFLLPDWWLIDRTSGLLLRP